MQHEVIVVAHEAEREGLGVQSFHGSIDHIEQRLAVSVVPEDRFLPVAA
jgi:hypothetical protein